MNRERAYRQVKVMRRPFELQLSDKVGHMAQRYNFVFKTTPREFILGQLLEKGNPRIRSDYTLRP